MSFCASHPVYCVAENSSGLVRVESVRVVMSADGFILVVVCSVVCVYNDRY